MPLPIPNKPWKIISIDFLGGFLSFRKGHDYLFVVVDKFSMMCVLIPCKNNITGQDVVDFFIFSSLSSFWVSYYYYL